jgi:hypothetical protein
MLKTAVVNKSDGNLLAIDEFIEMYRFSRVQCGKLIHAAFFYGNELLW